MMPNYVVTDFLTALLYIALFVVFWGTVIIIALHYFERRQAR